MKYRSKQWNITALMPLLVFFLFALCLLAVLLTGAGIYRQTVQQGQAQFAGRTAVQYLTTRVRQADCRGQTTVEPFGGTEALVFREEIGGEGYKTLVYCHEGFLRELFCPEDAQLSPGDGEKILAVQALTLRMEEALLHAELLLPDGSIRSAALQLRSGREALP